MALKILGGLLKGLSIPVVEHNSLRPTAVMLRRKIFDARQNLEGFDFIDLCAGSGAIGFEAWSRRAKKVCLVEPEPRLERTLNKMASSIREKYPQECQQRSLEVFALNAASFLRRLQADVASTILFLDPPYKNKEIYQSVLEWVERKSYRGELWLEGDEQVEPQEHWCQIMESLGAECRSYRSGSRYIIVGDFGL